MTPPKVGRTPRWAAVEEVVAATAEKRKWWRRAHSLSPARKSTTCLPCCRKRYHQCCVPAAGVVVGCRRRRLRVDHYDGGQQQQQWLTRYYHYRDDCWYLGQVFPVDPNHYYYYYSCYCWCCCCYYCCYHCYYHCYCDSPDCCWNADRSMRNSWLHCTVRPSTTLYPALPGSGGKAIVVLECRPTCFVSFLRVDTFASIIPISTIHRSACQRTSTFNMWGVWHV